ncbi:MAG: epoxyqueuosine reductase QueH, partial [Deltaproteobacteria bacterium]|nr:epoxyqueuosine reductase QueH [Deltaproteobacteria bacterium]
MLQGRTEVTGFFFNPNIHPRSEFKKRLEAAKTLAG